MSAREQQETTRRLEGLEKRLAEVEHQHALREKRLHRKMEQVLARMDAFAPEIDQPPISPPPFPECLREIGCRDPRDGG